MSVEYWLLSLILRNKKVKEAADKAVTDFMEGFTRGPMTPEQRIEGLKSIVENLKKESFPNAFEPRENYFQLLIGLMAESAFLKGEALVISDLYVPGYCFYFPRPVGEPAAGKPVKSSPWVDAGTDRVVQAPQGTAYFFYAVPLGADAADTVGKLLAGAADDPKANDASAFRDALAKRVGINPDVVIAIDRVGKARDAGYYTFVAHQDLFGESNLQIRPNGRTRSTIIKELEEFLRRSSY